MTKNERLITSIRKNWMRAKRNTSKITTPRPLLNQELLIQLGIAEELFKIGFDNLCWRWWDRKTAISRTSGGKLVAEVLTSHLTDPIILAIIADDIDAFKRQRFNETNGLLYLEFSCLCGAEKIITQSYLKENDKNKFLILAHNSIGYALSSGNFTLALILSKELIKRGKIDPGHIILYSFETIEHADFILKMFRDASMRQLKK